MKNPEFGEWMDEQLTDSETTDISVYLPETVAEADIERLEEAIVRVNAAGVHVGSARTI